MPRLATVAEEALELFEHDAGRRDARAPEPLARPALIPRARTDRSALRVHKHDALLRANAARGVAGPDRLHFEIDRRGVRQPLTAQHDHAQVGLADRTG